MIDFLLNLLQTMGGIALAVTIIVFARRRDEKQGGAK